MSKLVFWYVEKQWFLANYSFFVNNRSVTIIVGIGSEEDLNKYDEWIKNVKVIEKTKKK